MRRRGDGCGRRDHGCGMAGRAVTGKDRGKLSWGLLSSRRPLETLARCRLPRRHLRDGCPLSPPRALPDVTPTLQELP